MLFETANNLKPVLIKREYFNREVASLFFKIYFKSLMRRICVPVSHMGET